MARGGITPMNGKRGRSYKVRYDLPTPTPDGRTQGSKTFRTRREAEAYLTKIRHEILDGSFVSPPDAITLAKLCQRYLTTSASNVGSSTQVARLGIIRRHFLPRWGDWSADKVTESEVQALIDSLGRTHASSTARNILRVLSWVYDYGISLRLVLHNPCLAITKPKGRGKKIPIWSDREARAFLAQGSDDTLFPVYRLILMTGLRRCEALALQWDAVDSERSTITVRANLQRGLDQKFHRVEYAKTDTSTRRIVVDAETMATLVTWRQAAAERCRFTRAAIETSYVFPNWRVYHDHQHEDGPIDPKNFDKRFSRLVREIVNDDGRPVTVITLHGMRHTHASLLAGLGVDLRTIMERLGHATPGMTLERYMHGTIEGDRRAAQIFADLFAAERSLPSAAETRV